MPTGTDITTGFTTADVEVSPDRRFVGLPPRNVFLVNDCFDAGMALNWVELNMFKSQGISFIHHHQLGNRMVMKLQTLLYFSKLRQVMMMSFDLN